VADAVVVHGLADLNRAFRNADRATRLGERRALRAIGKPVAAAAEQLAFQQISNIGDHWSQMRVGVTQKVVYVAPSQRSKASRGNPQLRRPNLANLLMDRAMEPALEQQRNQVERDVDQFIDNVASVWEHT
jgi:hypothetical protein